MKNGLLNKMVILKGFKFGMFLQLAIGPVCLYIFSLASKQGFWPALAAVTAVALVDAVYILLALWGMVAFVRNEKNKKMLRWLGAIVLLTFGIQTVIGAIGWRLLPGLNVFKGWSVQGPFWEGILLTASNPLTILFWAGVLSAKVVAENLRGRQPYIFGLGCVLATISFLTLIALAGSMTKQFLPEAFVLILNVMVGLVLISFAFGMFLKKGKEEVIL